MKTEICLLVVVLFLAALCSEVDEDSVADLTPVRSINNSASAVQLLFSGSELRRFRREPAV